MMIYSKILSTLESELHARYDISSTIRHRGEKGRQREHGLAGFLKEYLPEAYGVATGELISVDGDDLSPQCDIIVYDRLVTPIIGKFEAVQQVLINGTYCVIEVKSHLTKASLDDAAQKYSKIRSLYPLSKDTKEAFSPALILFGYRMETSISACTDFVLEYSRNEDITVVALDSGITVRIGPEDNSIPSKIVWAPGTDFRYGIYSTLALFYTMILEVCHSTKLPTFDFKKCILGIGKET